MGLIKYKKTSGTTKVLRKKLPHNAALNVNHFADCSPVSGATNENFRLPACCCNGSDPETQVCYRKIHLEWLLSSCNPHPEKQIPREWEGIGQPQGAFDPSNLCRRSRRTSGKAPNILATQRLAFRQDQREIVFKLKVERAFAYASNTSKIRPSGHISVRLCRYRWSRKLYNQNNVSPLITAELRNTKSLVDLLTASLASYRAKNLYY